MLELLHIASATLALLAPPLSNMVTQGTMFVPSSHPVCMFVVLNATGCLQKPINRAPATVSLSQLTTRNHALQPAKQNSNLGKLLPSQKHFPVPPSQSHMLILPWWSSRSIPAQTAPSLWRVPPSSSSASQQPPSPCHIPVFNSMLRRKGQPPKETHSLQDLLMTHHPQLQPPCLYATHGLSLSASGRRWQKRVSPSSPHLVTPHPPPNPSRQPLLIPQHQMQHRHQCLLHSSHLHSKHSSPQKRKLPLA